MNDSERLFKILDKSKYKDLFNNVLRKYSGDIDGTFLGFMETYKHLAKIIPEDWVVVDLGCGYGFQCYYFRNHRKFIMVNPRMGRGDIFAPREWCDFVEDTTGGFLRNWSGGEQETKKKFGICNYVPPWYGEDSNKLVKKYFDYCYTFYPHL